MSANQPQRASSTSSTSSSNSSLFPAANVPTSPLPLSDLPPQQPHSSSLFSPPESQEVAASPSINSAPIAPNDANEDVIMANSELEAVIQQAGATTTPAGGKQSEGTIKERGTRRKDKLAMREEEDENAPGYAWRNRRAIEEYNKAQDGILDAKWSMKQFGDPFLEQLQGLPSGSTIPQDR